MSLGVSVCTHCYVTLCLFLSLRSLGYIFVNAKLVLLCYNQQPRSNNQAHRSCQGFSVLFNSNKKIRIIANCSKQSLFILQRKIYPFQRKIFLWVLPYFEKYLKCEGKIFQTLPHSSYIIIMMVYFKHEKVRYNSIKLTMMIYHWFSHNAPASIILALHLNNRKPWLLVQQ